MKPIPFESFPICRFAAERTVFRFVEFTVSSITCDLLSCEAYPRVESVMPARKMRVEMFDAEGNRYSIAFEGQMTRDKALRILDMVELLGGVQDANARSTRMAQSYAENTKYEQVHLLVSKNFPLVWFSSRDVQTAYEQEYKQPINLSTVATYLARMLKRGVLMKTGTSNQLRYKSSLSPPEVAVRQQITQRNG